MSMKKRYWGDKKTSWPKKGRRAVFLFFFFLLLCAAAACFLHGDESGSGGLQEQAVSGARAGGDGFPAGSASGGTLLNLALQEGVTVTADSVEAEQFSPEKAADGNHTDSGSRWSSANESGQPSHWLMFTFDDETQISFVRLYWERLNVEGFVLESSQDGETWTAAARVEEAPRANEQCVVLDRPARGRYFRIRTTAVSESEENQYLYYQNVSLLEAELYEEVLLSWSLEGPSIETGEDGSRRLVLPSVPEDVQIELAGADYKEVIGADGTVYPTVEEKEVEVGFLLTKDGVSEETPGYTVTVPAAEREAGGGANPARGTETAASGANSASETETADSGRDAAGEAQSRPSVTPEVAEWRAGNGSFMLQEGSRILADEKWLQEASSALSSLREAAEAASREAREEDDAGSERLLAGTREDLREGDIYLGLASEELGLGEEGYLCEIRSDGILLLAEQKQGLIWGVNTLCQLLDGENGKKGTIACGTIRDYPRYSVRGFSIDIGRRMVSMETLREMVRALSARKMNTLGVHLNDNEILSTSGKNDSIKNAFTAYSGFRLESSLKNGEGEQLTSQDGSFTKEEWKEFTEWAAGLGVEVVPEIDTPAHSLSITRLFPEAALADEPENVDQLDLSRRETIALMEGLWREYLDGEDPVFAGGGTVHIGMDEYYGDVQDYQAYMQQMALLIAESGRTVRMWGSLSLIGQANEKNSGAAGGLSGVLRGRLSAMQSDSPADLSGSRADLPADLQKDYRLWTEEQAGDTSGEGKEAGVPLSQIQVQIWSALWSDPQTTYRAGYTVINSLNSSLYIIPGGGYDYLDLEALSTWEPNEYPMGGQTQVLPAWSERVAGAIYCLWNDTIGSLEAGITEEGIYDRFSQPLSLLSGKLW